MKLPNKDLFFREVTLRMCGSLDISEALCTTCNYIKQYIPLDFAGLFYLTANRDEVYSVAVQNMPGADMKIFDHSNEPIIILDEEDREELNRLHPEDAVKDTVEIHNTREEKPWFSIKHFPDWQHYSHLMLNLHIKDNALGVLVIVAQRSNSYTPEHAHLMEYVKDPIALAMSNARRFIETVRLKDLLAEDNRTIYREMGRLSGNQVIGEDFGLRQVMDLIRQVAPTSSPVLLTGETGTGKEVIANAIHLSSHRSDKPFIRVQCGAIPETLLDSELFGHEKGAFTGAMTAKRGRFERAEGGTIFLDEIAELSPDAQVKLLRVLQEKTFERLGGSKTIHADVRVIAATHRDLVDRVQTGAFREDLWFRLNVFPIHLPPLRARREDIPALAHHFIQRKCREMNLTPPTLPPDLNEKLQTYDWPGNVRELQNIIERALILSSGKTLALPPLGSGKTISELTNNHDAQLPTLNQITADHIRKALVQTNGRIEGPGGAAELLDINHGTLRARMKKLGIAFGRNAPPLVKS